MPTPATTTYARSIYKWLEKDIKNRGGTVVKSTSVERVERLSGPGDPPVQLTVRTATGTELLPADRVVSTLPVGVIKQVVQDKLVKFSPGLPSGYTRTPSRASAPACWRRS